MDACASHLPRIIAVLAHAHVRSAPLEHVRLDIRLHYRTDVTAFDWGHLDERLSRLERACPRLLVMITVLCLTFLAESATTQEVKDAIWNRLPRLQGDPDRLHMEALVGVLSEYAHRRRKGL